MTKPTAGGRLGFIEVHRAQSCRPNDDRVTGVSGAVGVTKTGPLVAIASPIADEFAVNIPGAFCTTVIGAGALVYPLAVTVTVPEPTGTEDARIAATCVAPA